MNELSLFTGAGGGLLGTLLLGWRPIGYVEWNDYCQRIIAQRITDGILPNAPIFGDIKAFIDSGSAELYRGVTDVITAGFNCQPFSSAGIGKGEHDERNTWPETAECVRIIRPLYVFLENVPNLLVYRYYGTILGGLAQMGYDARWGVFSACAFGAPHTRERLFILAYANSERRQRGSERQRSSASAGRREKEKRTLDNSQAATPFRPTLWHSTEADFLGMVDGLGAKVERLRATGNGQVPAVVRAAWHLLSEGLDP